MFDKIKKVFNNKEKKKENMITFLIILVITLIIINKILVTPEVKQEESLEKDAYLATTSEIEKDVDIETRLEEILDTLKGVSNVSVMLTYNESSSIVPVYNINESIAKTDKDESISTEKEVVVDSESKVITEKTITPKIEGAIITAKGVSDPTTKGNVISAVEAVTGLMTHKIQVFEMGE